MSQIFSGGVTLSRELPGYLRDWIDQNLVGGIAGCYLEAGYPIFYMNERFHRHLGYGYEERLTVSEGLFLNTVYEEDRGRVEAAIQGAVREGRSFSVDFRMPHKSGDMLWVRDSGSSIVENGRVMLFHVCVDITEMVRLREELAERNNQISSLFDSLPCGICKCRIDDDFTILYANDFYYGTYGYSSAQACAEGFGMASFVVHPADFPTVKRQIHAFLREGRREFELEHRAIHRSGAIIWMLSRCTFHPDEPDCLFCVLLNITDRKQMEERLRLSEEENRIAFSDSDRMMAIYDVASRTLVQPGQSAALFGAGRVVRNVPDSLFSLGIVAEESVADYRSFFEAIQQGVPRGELLAHLRDRDGSYHWISAKYTLIFSGDGEPQRAIVSYDDVTEQREKELAYQKWSQHFDTERKNCVGYYEYNLTKDSFRQVLSPYITLPAELTSFHEVACFMSEHFVYEEDLQPYLEFLDRGRMLVEFYAGRRELMLEYRRRDSEGELFWARTTVQLMSDPYTGDIMAFLLIKDIDAEKKAFLRLRRRLDTDVLTGLFNRGAIAERVASILEESGPADCHAFLMLDIDHFKELNDRFGHQFGDQVLKDAAASMRNTLRGGDLCGRLGGDEFVIFLRGIRSVDATRERLLQLCRLLNMSNDAGANISVSIGLSAYPRDGASFNELYLRADEALYEAKRQGRNRYVIYEPGRIDCPVWRGEADEGRC